MLRELARSSAIRPGELHRLHRSLRRLRLCARTWRELIGPDGRALGRALLLDLGSFTRACGKVRDLDVAAALTSRSIPRRTPDSEKLAAWRKSLRSDASRGRRTLSRVARILVGESRIRGLTALVRRIGSTSLESRWFDSFTRTASRLCTQARTALRRAQRNPTMGRLHDLRRRVRSLRLLGELGIASSSALSLPALRRLLASIGEFRDLQLLLVGGSRLPTARAPTGWLIARRNDCRRFQQKIADRLGRRTIEAELSRLDSTVQA
ncbi:MAG: CHAD domain-containing protein [Thermoplasmata archaeon]|nr:CHAD domain-containing protein [Thermoplasmata archaeon]